MKSVKQTIKIENVMSKDGKHRYSQSRIWDKNKPMVTVVTIYPGSDGVLKQDLTTMLIVNNCVELGYGGVYLVNLFSKLGLTSKNKKLFKGAYNSQTDEIILQCAELGEQVIMAYGSIVKTSNIVKKRAEIVTALLKESKTNVIFLKDDNNNCIHPLSPVARLSWQISEK